MWAMPLRASSALTEGMKDRSAALCGAWAPPWGLEGRLDEWEDWKEDEGDEVVLGCGVLKPMVVRLPVGCPCWPWRRKCDWWLPPAEFEEKVEEEEEEEEVVVVVVEDDESGLGRGMKVLVSPAALFLLTGWLEVTFGVLAGEALRLLSAGEDPLSPPGVAWAPGVGRVLCQSSSKVNRGSSEFWRRWLYCFREGDERSSSLEWRSDSSWRTAPLARLRSLRGAFRRG